MLLPSNLFPGFHFRVSHCRRFGPKEDHEKLMGATAKSYHDANKRFSRSDVVTAFKKRENFYPQDLLQ
jgi:hypothetical protein